MKLSLLQILCLIIFGFFLSPNFNAQNYKVNISFFNSTDDTINAIGIQKGLTINPRNQPNVITTQKLAPNSTYKHEEKIKVKKGQSIFFYVSTDSTEGMIYYGFHRFNERENNYTLSIDNIETTKAFTEADQINAKLNQIGITDIDQGSRIKMEVVTSDISNIMDYLPGIMIVDTSKIKNNLVPDNALYRTFYRPRALGIIPEPINVSGNTIEDNLVIESDGTISSQFSFPFAANVNLDITNKGFYKVNVAIKNAGWVPVSAENVRTPLESIFHLDSIGALTTLVGMYKKLLNSNYNRLFSVEEGFIFSELVAQTVQYTENNIAYEGNYASVVTSKGGYVRSNRADHIDTRPTTLVYVSLTNDHTDEAKEILKNILLKDYIEKYLGGKPQSPEVVDALPEDTINKINNLDPTQLNLEISRLKNELEREKKTLID